MPLHRDIFWIGRQWAVTGHGIQAVDQRLKGAFDIPCDRVWDEGLAARLRPLDWFKEADFDKAIAVARGRFAAPAAQPVAPAASAPVEAAILSLTTAGELAKFLPQWRIRH